MELSRRVNTLVGHQLARWESAGRLDHPHPSIAIASLPGAGGEELGHRVGDALHYNVFGREIVDEIARRRGVGERLLRGLDQRMRTAVERYVTDLFETRRFHERDYFAEVVRAVAALGRRGEVVIVGRGSAFLLPPDTTLRVLATASTPSRVARIAGLRGVSTERAREFVEAEDERRRAYVRHHFGARIDDPNAYDLVVNTGALGIDLAAGTIVHVFRARLLAEQPASGTGSHERHA